MARYEERTIDLPGPVEIEGRIIEVLNYNRNTRRARVLVEINPVVSTGDIAGLSVAAIADTEGIDVRSANEEELEDRFGTPDDPRCGYPKSDGSPCTREVETIGERCWQHEKEDR